MKILAVDSTTRTACAALTEDTRTLASFTSDSGPTQSERLLPMVEEVLRAARVRVEDIDLFAATVGPGSFTGVRIGVSVVKGLAFGSNKPCVAVSALEAMAEELMPLEGIYCPVIDARRRQVYTALFCCKDGQLVRLTEDDLLPIDELLTVLATYNLPVLLTGDAAKAVKEAARVTMPQLHFPILPSDLTLPSGTAVARCAFRAAKEGRTLSEEALVPVYLRPTQAERERQEREEQKEKETMSC